MSQTPEEQVPEAYCKLTDLRKGDIRLPSYMGDGSSYLVGAALEIDAALGHIYKTPFVIEETAANRPAILMLRKINWLIGSGRLILDLAAAGENDTQHAYGASMLREGLALLNNLVAEKIVLTGAEKLPADTDDENSFRGPAIFNEDPESLVEGFYRRGALTATGLPAPMPRAYGIHPGPVL